MKENVTARIRLTAVVFATTFAALALITPQLLPAQAATEKVRLMADTLRARDAGNLELAKEKAEELIKIAPEDENVQRLLASINRDLDSGTEADAEDRPAVYGQAPDMPLETAMEMDPEAGQAEAVVEAAASDQEKRIQAARSAIEEARLLAELGSFSDANELLNNAEDILPLNTATEGTIEAIEKTKADLILMEARTLVDDGRLKAAEILVEEYRAAGGKASVADSMARSLDRAISNPYKEDIEEVSPEYVAKSKTIRDLVTRGRAQFLNGDYEGAEATFQEVEARDANNPEAKLFQTRIAKLLGGIHDQNRYKTREQMLTNVDRAWERPKVFDVQRGAGPGVPVVTDLQERLKNINIPQVNFSGMELTRVIETLSELSQIHDPDGEGVNIVPIFNPAETNPRVNISLRNLNLDRVLQFVTQQVDFSYDVGSDAVTVVRSDSIGGVGGGTTITEFFPINRATVIRLTGAPGDGGGSAPIDPFAPSGGVGGGSDSNEETEALQSFFQSAGVNFEIPGASLAFDGEQLIVTQSRRNLERMRTILRNYNEIKQVEIEAKFLEVAQNDLEELGFNWSIGEGALPILDDDGFAQTDQFGNPVEAYQRTGEVQGRSINQAFSAGEVENNIQISGFEPIPVSPPSLSTAIDLGASAGPLFSGTGWTAGGIDVDLAVRALSRKTGSDLMSAPKVTVLSGKRATITVAQELRYPESYGDIESNVSSPRGDNAGGGGSISITAGTPQDFNTRNVGVEMSVTPNVENDDTISLLLEPRVTQFEGFVEYGGPSVAISGATGGGLDPIDGILSGGTDATVVTVPSGFYQPIFSTRAMETEVTVFDGATLVMGGLTRDEVRTVNDKVPVLGDIPGVGRLFRSEGETRQKRNLLIFVTANLVSPGGSPARQNYRNVDANSLFQNPTIMTPAGSANRSISDEGQ